MKDNFDLLLHLFDNFSSGDFADAHNGKNADKSVTDINFIHQKVKTVGRNTAEVWAVIHLFTLIIKDVSLSLVVCLWHYFLLASSFLLSFSWPSVLCRCEICNSVGSSKWLMVHPSVILRQAGEYVHFAWFPSSIFQTSPELGGDTAWNGFQEKQQHKWKSRPRWYNHFVQHEHFCKHVWRGGGGGGGGGSGGGGGGGGGGRLCRAGAKASV